MINRALKTPACLDDTAKLDDVNIQWRASELKERSAAQEHFIDLCRLLGEPTAAGRATRPLAHPPEWVEWVEEPVPGYPARPVPRYEEAAKALKNRTLTNLYNARPQWLLDAHAQLDETVAAAYSWPSDMMDDAALWKPLARNCLLG